MKFRLWDPIDTLSPLELVIDPERGHNPDEVWLSPDRNICTGLTWMDECGRLDFTLVAYREGEVIP